MKRILIGGTHSGCGKTTITCAILKALQLQGRPVSAFKCGPDYIDPMFHREIIGASSTNLDSFFCAPEVLRRILREGAEGTDIAVIEGVMGYFDGMRSGSSAYDIARITDTPAVIVVNARGMSESLGALIEGFLHYREDAHIAGFLFNQLSASLVPAARALCEGLGTRFVGFMPRHQISLESRNLGLVTAEEVPDLQERLEALADLAAQYIDLDLLLEIADIGALPQEDDPAAMVTHVPAPEVSDCPGVPAPTASSAPAIAEDAPVIAVARDRAFCFCYPENIRLLEENGCRIRYFSPLQDRALPADADGLYLCGGYPELHAQALSENASMRRSVREAVEGGLPTIAECGGFLYLHRGLRLTDGTEERTWPMCGIIDAEAYEKKFLQRFGYITLTAHADSLLFEAGQQIPAHEFHYWDSEAPGDAFDAEKPDGRSWKCGIVSPTLYAAFPHLYFYARPQMAERFTTAARACHRRKAPITT